ncbi:MAG: TlpA family protein disulfide reductase [Polaromonas sp.]|nr:TlpA family protein disulfide reductase [Polaromonas sp.]
MLYGGAAAAAVTLGVGLSWWRTPTTTMAAAGEAGARAVEEAFWAMSFDSPSGVPLAMASLRGKPLLVNFWATWCPPCVEELPLLDFFYQENKAKGWQVLGLAVDQPSTVRTWLQTRPLNFPMGMAGLGGTDLSKSMGNVAGSLPFTAVFGKSGTVLHRKIGKVLPEDLVQWASLR